MLFGENVDISLLAIGLECLLGMRFVAVLSLDLMDEAMLNAA